MDKIELNHWYINGNELSITLLRFYALIKTLINEDKVCFQLEVTDNSNVKGILLFNTLEDAISFVENDIVNSKTCYDVYNAYVNNTHISKKNVLIK